MKRQVVQHFLNTPGIAGVALIDSRTRPFFCGLETTLNTQQKDALAQGIQQVVGTTPAEFDGFSFRFGERQVHIYRLAQGVILLVLTHDDLPHQDYATALQQLKGTLAEDPGSAVATFRLLAGSLTLNNPPFNADGRETGSLNLAAPSTAAVPAAIQCQTVLTALNHLSDFTTQYLGKIVVANNWKAARPQQPWLDQFDVNRSAQLSASSPALAESALTEEQHQWLKAWADSFIARCGRVIRDFPRIVVEQALDADQKALLLEHKS